MRPSLLASLIAGAVLGCCLGAGQFSDAAPAPPVITTTVTHMPAEQTKPDLYAKDVFLEPLKTGPNRPIRTVGLPEVNTNGLVRMIPCLAVVGPLGSVRATLPAGYLSASDVQIPFYDKENRILRTVDVKYEPKRHQPISISVTDYENGVAKATGSVDITASWLSRQKI